MLPTEAMESAPRRQMRWLPIQAIQPNPHQPRRQMDAQQMDELTASIRELGLLQPVTVRVVGRNRYELIAGERRLRACERNGMTHIDAIVLPASDADSALMAMVENLQRESLHYLDEAQGYEAILRTCNMSQQALADRLGKSQGTLANKLRLLQLPESVRDLLRRYALSERHARALLRLPEERRQLQAARGMAERKLTVREAEAYVESLLRAPKPKRRVWAIMRDHRPYVNAIRDIVLQMQNTGVPAKVDVREETDFIEVTVRMPRRALPEQAPASPMAEEKLALRAT